MSNSKKVPSKVRFLIKSKGYSGKWGEDQCMREVIGNSRVIFSKPERVSIEKVSIYN